MKILVTVKPNARQTKITKISETEIHAEIKAPPKDGKANELLIKALAIFFSIPQSHITIKKGLSGKKKYIEILHV